ncbi:MAG TPA: sigma-70 family RNA polymerase sigma factor [Candidatus Scatosoma pullistercoris]|uniref:Sigma-70 family RNA polymerase sigma factor n=1 Tax=Candidatus Scatosoma pullistercoris TaxID=2840934 RepID=A0A9D1MF97_9FIRM|nr:sigma-70 family RNA polymerase sigma factor [Candidatus Scatosoma pullistercoris]
MEKIYMEYSDKVLRYVRSKISDPQDAEDVCSAVFLKVQKGLSLYDHAKSSFSTWIYSIARNAVIDFYRRSRETAPLDEEIACTENGFEDICNDEMLDLLASALESLSPRESDVIVLHYYSGKSLKEIAASMQMSYSNMKLLHQKALSKLKKLLQFKEE